MNFQIEKPTVASIVSKDIRAAHVFKKYGIDFCCGGDQTLSSVCQNQGIEMEKVLKDLSMRLQSTGASHNYAAWDLTFLVDYIVNVHHSFVIENIPLLEAYSDKVTKTHGKEHSFLGEIDSLLQELFSDLQSHLKDEEQLLFKHVKKLVLAEKHLDILRDLQPIKGHVSKLHEDHDRAGMILHKINKLTGSFTTPIGACPTFLAFYNKMEEFFDDLMVHIHLENNILFPKAVILEEKLSKLQ